MVNLRGAWVHRGPVDHSLAQQFDVVLGDGLGVRELLCKDHGDTDLAGLDVGVGRNDRTGGIVDTLALQVGRT